MSENNDNVVDEPRYAWVLAAAGCILMALSFGGLGSVGVFLKPMVNEFGWSRGNASMGYTILSLGAAAFGLVWGYVADKWGSRGAIFASTLAMPIALFILSRTESLWQFYLGYFVFGAVGFAAMFSPMMATVGFWFEKHKGIAIGIVAAGGAVGQGIIPFSARLLITDFSWQDAYLFLAIGYLIIGVPVAFIVREAPVRLAARDSASTGSSVETDYPFSPNQAIIWISFAALFCCICMAVPIVHVVPLVSDRGISPEIAASVLMVIMTAGILGRLLGGVAGGKFGAIPAYMFFSFGQTVLAFLFPHVSSLTGTYVLAAIFGVIYSGDMVAILYCSRVMVPPKYAGKALAIGSGMGMIGMGAGGYIGGALYDYTGSYDWSFAAASLFGVVNLIILIAFLKVYRKQSAKVVMA